jgi:hypothetical protein
LRGYDLLHLFGGTPWFGDDDRARKTELRKIGDEEGGVLFSPTPAVIDLRSLIHHGTPDGGSHEVEEQIPDREHQ